MDDERYILTLEVCEEYYKRACEIGGLPEDIGARRELRLELQEKYDLNEVEAVNILNGYNFDSYIRLKQYRTEKAIAEEEHVRKTGKKIRKRHSRLDPDYHPSGKQKSEEDDNEETIY